MNTILAKIASIIATPIFLLSSLFNPVIPPPEITPAPIVENVGAILPQATGVFETSLATAITSTATSATLTSNAVRGGGSVSGYTCLTVDEGSAQAEVMCGTVSSTAVTSITRGISYADGVTALSANKFAHRRGANVKITDYPIIQILKAQNNGDATFPNPLQYASGVGPTASSDLTDKEYVLSVVSGGTVSFEKVVVAGTAGETLVAGNLVYLKSSDNRWWLTDADTASTVENVILGISQGAGTAGGAVTGGVLTSGIDSNQSGLSASTIYYASNTAGALSSSAGTKEVTIGISLSTTSIAFAPRYNQNLTEDEQDAIAGTTGTPSSTNKFITQQNTSTASIEQSQTTQDANSAVGEADATTKRNLIAQSFIPALPKISGVKLYKDTNTGTFTGTVKVAIQADTTGSPSGSDLVSVTLTNAQYLALANGEFTAQFATDYTALTIGSTYWIVITCSTSDNSNHPNLGTNSAGGYASGSVKYKNVTDGWGAVATIDLYFKTIEGVQSQVVKTGTDGLVPLALTQPNRNRTFLYVGSADISASTNTVTITHNLGKNPSSVRFSSTFNFDNASLTVSNSFGSALIASDGTATYASIYGVNAGTGSLNGSATDAIGILSEAGSSLTNYAKVTVSSVGQTTLGLTFTKNGTPSAFTFYYVVEISL